MVQKKIWKDVAQRKIHAVLGKEIVTTIRIVKEISSVAKITAMISLRGIPQIVVQRRKVILQRDRACDIEG